MFNMCIKVGLHPTLSEAHAMRFVAQHTSIPVPKVHCAFIHKGRSYIVMSRIKGTMTKNGWLARSEESKAKILAQLRDMLVELRSVQPPEGTRIGAVGGGSFHDPRLEGRALWGPYDSPRDFHKALTGGFDPDGDCSNWPEDFRALLAFYRDYSSSRLVLTHGDLSSLNILVEADEVRGIVDWETSGWLPPYWEYTCAKYVSPYDVFWGVEVDKFLEPFPYELEMDEIRRKYFGLG